MSKLFHILGEAIPEVWEKSIFELLEKGEWTLKAGATEKHRILNCALIAEIRNPSAEPRLHPKLSKTMAEIYKREIIEGHEQHREGKCLTPFVYDYHERVFHYRPFLDQAIEVNQLELAVKRIQKEKFTNQAVITTLIPHRDDKIVQEAWAKNQNPSIPCLSFLQFIATPDGRLDMFTVFRSHDAFRAAPYNWYGLSYLQEEVASRLGLSVGKYYSFSTSYHIYDSALKDVERTVGKPKKTSFATLQP